MNRQATSLLVIDQVASSRERTAQILQTQGYDVIQAAGGAQALSLVEQHQIALVLLDDGAAESRGLAVLQSLRQMHAASLLPVIMLAPTIDGDDAITALKLGANDCVGKPLNPPALLARIECQLARRQAELASRQAQEDLKQRMRERATQLLNINKLLHDEIAERKRTEKTLRRREQRYRQLYDDTPAMFFTLSTQGKILSVNQFGAAGMGYALAELVNQPFTMLLREADRKSLQERLANCLSKPETIHRWEICKVRKDGQPLWVRESARVMTDVAGRTTILVVCEDISEAHYLAQQLSHQASHDDLTGLVNRREFERRLQRVLKTAREDRSEHALCYLDLDRFKIINDQCGHAAGDDLLRQLADLLQKKLRQRDTLARLGGDEFGVLMEHCPLSQARQIADELRETINGFKLHWENKTYSVGVSIGLVPVSYASESLATVLSAADSACYLAKDAGRNRVHEHNEADTRTSLRNTEIRRVVQIDRALDEGRWELYFQPIIPLAAGSGAEHHYELLVRMRGDGGSPEGVGPLLSIAERFDLISKIDRWVIDTAFGWLARHSAQLARTALCTINLSGQSLIDEEFCHAIQYQLEKTGVPSDKICFEITETAAIVNMAKAGRFMRVLKDQGCRFALDDFGAALSSFAYLKNLPVDFLKIDGQFVKDIVEDAMDLEMVKSINGIGHVMGKKTIAEFVESEAILAKLREIGVDYAQGYHIGRPRPLDEFV
jgi:diguanylate cyclase (GGDEF)-like protein/PAS domain S-box-containing protein